MDMIEEKDKKGKPAFANLQFSHSLCITGEIECLTGLHIGNGDTDIGIGGTDNAVIIGWKECNKKWTRVPVIPGSSLKGKMRALIELTQKKPSGGPYLDPDGNIHQCTEVDCPLCTTFGSGADDTTKRGPTRLIVRDAKPTDKTIIMWEAHEDIVHGTEIKGENWLNRITSHATPRFIERVVTGSVFDFEMILSFYREGDDECVRLLLTGMHLIQENYLGGSGTRGYGKIRFKNLKFLVKGVDDYKNLNTWSDITPAGFTGEISPANIDDVMKKLLEKNSS